MGFKRLLASLGAGGASVETVLTEVNVVPGGVVQGEVRIQGGSVDQQIEALSVGLQARVEVEGQDSEYKQDMVFTKQRLGGAFELKAEAVHVVPFGLEIPWETPVTTIQGQTLPGMNIGVTTELEIARAVDSGDLDPINVHPLPAQQAILDAFIQLGFRFKNADLERGHIRGTRQKLPFYQEIEFYPPQQYHGLNQVELSFVADEPRDGRRAGDGQEAGAVQRGQRLVPFVPGGAARLPGHGLGRVPEPVAVGGRQQAQLVLGSTYLEPHLPRIHQEVLR